MLTVAAATGLSIASIGLAAPGAMAQPTKVAAGDFNATASGNIAALQKIKGSLTPAEKKLDSKLAVQLKKSTDATAARVGTGVAVSKAGTVSVDIKATKVTADLTKRLTQAGAVVRYASTNVNQVRADVPLSALTKIAGFADVKHVSTAVGAQTQQKTQPGKAVVAESKEAKAARIDKQLTAALATPAAAGQGDVVSEGDKAHAADIARQKKKVTGTGVKICVLSDGVDSLSVSEASGELPAVDVLTGQEGSGDEGTAMLEIVHDIAPGADLGFATAFTSDASFADNIRDLRTVGHCDIIVDDVIYYNESPFQDGPIAQSVNFVTADGALYFSSAGNQGNKLSGTSGNWEGQFVDSGRSVGKFAGAAHDFDPGTGVQVFDPLSPNSAGTVTTLFWSDPAGGAGDDYDLYVFDSTGAVVALSQDVQDGDDDPFEILQIPFGSNLKLAVVKFSGASQYFQVTTFGGRFAANSGLTAFSTNGSIRGHAAAADAYSVAAAPAADPLPFSLEPGDPPNPSGPYPNPYTKDQKVEPFSADGPRRVFFDADGTPLAAGGVVRQDPDITAADGVNTSVDGFAPFFGTSAAAPHAAAIAGLILSGNPGATDADVREAFNATALDLAPTGRDDRSGPGILRADKVLNYTGATPQPLVRAGSPTVTPTTGDGDAYLEPGETATVAIPATNVGDGTATGVSVTVTTTDAGVTVTPRNRSYGSIAAGATKSGNFTVKLAANYPVGKPVALSVKITFAGVLSPTTSTVRIPTGQPAATPTDFTYTGPAVPIPDGTNVPAAATVAVSGITYASKITFSIDGTTCTADAGATTVGIDHTYVSDLTGTLTGPDGRTARLFAASGGSGNNLCKVVFDDAATTPFSSVTSAQAPYTGTYKPIDSLNQFLSGSVSGTWTFKVSDSFPADSGNIRAFSLHITGFVA